MPLEASRFLASGGGELLPSQFPGEAGELEAFIDLQFARAPAEVMRLPSIMRDTAIEAWVYTRVYSVMAAAQSADPLSFSVDQGTLSESYSAEQRASASKRLAHWEGIYRGFFPRQAATSGTGRVRHGY